MGKISCALSSTQIENLYKDLYKNMSNLGKGQTFDPNAYMSKLFSDIKNKRDKETAAKFVQPIPRLLTNIAMRYPDIEVSVDGVRRLIKQYEDVNSGINKIIADLDEVDTTKSLQALKDLNKYIVNNYKSTQGLEDVTLPDTEYLPLTVYAGTLQELKPDVKKRDAGRIDIEILADETKYVYNLIKNLSLSNNEFNNLNGYVNYQGKNLQLKTYTLFDLYNDRGLAKNIPAKIRSQIGASTKMVKDNQNLSRRVALVFVDSNENFVFFDENGNITDQENGKIAFQYIRRIDKEGERYQAVNFDGTDISVISPYMLANRDLTVNPEELEILQQEEFKKVYNLIEKVRKGGKFNL